MNLNQFRFCEKVRKLNMFDVKLVYMCCMFIVCDGYRLNVSYMMFEWSLSGSFRVKASCGSRIGILPTDKFAARRGSTRRVL